MHTVPIFEVSEFVPFLLSHKWWAAEKASGFTSYLKRDWICNRCYFLVYLFDDVLYGNGHRLINLHKKRRNKLFLAPRRTMGHNHPRIQINFIHANELLVLTASIIGRPFHKNSNYNSAVNDDVIERSKNLIPQFVSKRLPKGNATFNLMIINNNVIKYHFSRLVI